MQGNNAVLTKSFTAGSALAQYQPITAAGAAATAASNAVGATTISCDSGALVPAVVLGTCLMIAGGSIAAGALVEVHTTVTKVVTKSAGVSIGRYIGSTTAADGDVIEVLLIPN